LGIPCCFPQNFEKITHRVQSKNKDQVRNYQDVLSVLAIIGQGRVGVGVGVWVGGEGGGGGGGGGGGLDVNIPMGEVPYPCNQSLFFNFQLISLFVLLPFLSNLV